VTPPLPPDTYSIEDLAKGTRAQIEFSISASDMRLFGALSGDYNPLHLDDTFAKSKGFDGVVVYGALVVAKISQLIGMRLPGRDGVWCSFSLQFCAPLYVGENAQAAVVVSAVSDSTGMVELALTIRNKDRLLAKGKAEVLLVAR
jgi:acyl dehydratase